MKTSKIISLLAVTALAWIGGSTFAADLSPGDKQFLSGYEKLRVALVADDLDSARKWGFTLMAFPGAGDAAKALASSRSLDEARAAFSKLSDSAQKLAAGKPGYYVMHCPMVNKDWVQTTTEVGNPYGGKEMVGCGELKK